jgi:hypothetical protein
VTTADDFGGAFFLLLADLRLAVRDDSPPSRVGMGTLLTSRQCLTERMRWGRLLTGIWMRKNFSALLSSLLFFLASASCARWLFFLVMHAVAKELQTPEAGRKNRKEEIYYYIKIHAARAKTQIHTCLERRPLDVSCAVAGETDDHPLLVDRLTPLGDVDDPLVVRLRPRQLLGALLAGQEVVDGGHVAGSLPLLVELQQGQVQVGEGLVSEREEEGRLVGRSRLLPLERAPHEGGRPDVGGARRAGGGDVDLLHPEDMLVVKPYLDQLYLRLVPRAPHHDPLLVRRVGVDGGEDAVLVVDLLAQITRRLLLDEFGKALRVPHLLQLARRLLRDGGGVGLPRDQAGKRRIRGQVERSPRCYSSHWGRGRRRRRSRRTRRRWSWMRRLTAACSSRRPRGRLQHACRQPPSVGGDRGGGVPLPL